MINYVIEEAKKSKILTDIYVNSDCDEIITRKFSG